MKRVLAITIFVLISNLPCLAQYRSRADSSYVTLRSEFRPTQLIAPTVLLGAGIAIHYASRDRDKNVLDSSIDGAIHNKVAEHWGAEDPDSHIKFDDYIQYVPLALDLFVGMTGVKAQHTFVDRSIETALSMATLGILSWTGKTAFHTMRPNGSNYASFPSGHTDFAFCGAELVRMEYGWGWGAGAYAVATTVAAMRIYRNWHWFSDVLAGAGLGILCAHIGGWLLEPTKKLFGIQTVIIPTIDNKSGTFCATLSMRF